MNIIEIIEKVINSEQMIDSILESVINAPDINFLCKYNKLDDVIIDRFSIILQYYITSRDSKIDYSFEDIVEKYSKLQKKNISENNEIYNNVIANRIFNSCI